MDFEQEDTQNKSCSCKTKPPMDVRIVAYFLYAVGFFQLACAVLLITGIGRREAGYTRWVFFGAVLLSTTLAWVFYMLFGGLAHVLSAWGLIRKCKFGWWFTLLFSIYYLIDDVFFFPKNQFIASIGIVISIGIITWLWFRMNVYYIGLKAKSSAET